MLLTKRTRALSKDKGNGFEFLVYGFWFIDQTHN